MPDPKKPTAAEKLVMLQQIAKQRAQAGEPPSQQVAVALNSFNGQPSPTPEEIQRIAEQIAASGNAAGALEFEAYAQTFAAADNRLRRDMQRRADAGVGPSPPVVEALNSFDAPPTPQEIQTMGRFLRKKHGDAVGQEFETYAATAVAQQANAGYSKSLVDPVRPSPSDYQGAQPQGPAVNRAAPAPQPQPQPQQAPVTQAGSEQDLVARAKDILQGAGHIVTLGAIPAPESIVSGNDRLRGMVGLEPLQKKPRQGKTEVEPPRATRDKNKERDLLNEAKRIDG